MSRRDAEGMEASGADAEHALRMQEWFQEAGLLQTEQERLEQELSSGSSEGVLMLHSQDDSTSLPESPRALKQQELRLNAEIKQLLQSARQTFTPLAADQDQSAGFDCSSHPRQEASMQPSAVSEYQAFTKLHGLHGGWTSEDAAEFEKVLRACRGEYNLAVQICDERLIGCSREAVLAHARWHARERELHAKQKVAIAAWRQERRTAAMEKAAAAAANDTLDPKAAQQLHERQQRCQQQRMHKQEAVHQAVAEWKRTKDSEKAQVRAAQQCAQQAQREQAARLKADQMARDARFAERAEQMKARKAETAADSTHEQLEVRPDPDAALNIQMRNLALTERKAHLLASKESARIAHQERMVRLHHQALERLPFQASTDAARVRQPTAAAQIRKAETSNEDRSARDSSFIRHLKPRAVAAWRRGLC